MLRGDGNVSEAGIKGFKHKTCNEADTILSQICPYFERLAVLLLLGSRRAEIVWWAVKGSIPRENFDNADYVCTFNCGFENNLLNRSHVNYLCTHTQSSTTVYAIAM